MRVYSVREVAAAAGLCRRSVYRAVQRGDIAVQRSPSGWFMGVSDAAVDSWLSGNGQEVLARSLRWSRRRNKPNGQPTTPDTAIPTSNEPPRPHPRKDKR